HDAHRPRRPDRGALEPPAACPQWLRQLSWPTPSPRMRPDTVLMRRDPFPARPGPTIVLYFGQDDAPAGGNGAPPHQRPASKGQHQRASIKGPASKARIKGPHRRARSKGPTSKDPHRKAHIERPTSKGP